MYDFSYFQRQVMLFKHMYSFLQIFSIGETLLGKPIYCLRFGKGPYKIHINGTHHANEWITALVLMQSIQNLCDRYQDKQRKMDDFIQAFYDRVTFDFIPMLNPDGVDICIHGTMNENIIPIVKEMKKEGKTFNDWKANARGVDLNRNYDAGFNEYKKVAQNRKPSYAYYAGLSPESEPETSVLATFTRQNNYEMILSYHTQGEVIYRDYQGYVPPKGEYYAEKFSKISGYILDTPEIQAASAGYKDWFIDYFQRPGFTIECGRGENPLSIMQYPSIVEKTFPIILFIAKSFTGEKKDGSI